MNNQNQNQEDENRILKEECNMLIDHNLELKRLIATKKEEIKKQKKS